MLEPIIQEETTGCGVALAANTLGKSYAEMKAIANNMGIDAADESLWSDTQYVRRMLASQGVSTSDHETPFTSWSDLPDLALLSIKHYQVADKKFWYWVVFKRINDQEYVLDSASYLASNIRQDFEALRLCNPSGLLRLQMHNKLVKPTAKRLGVLFPPLRSGCGLPRR